jgi:hypothetical protein
MEPLMALATSRHVVKCRDLGATELELFSRLRNHTPFVNLVGNCVSGAAVDGGFWLQPSLGDGAIDNMPLNPAAVWAAKRSQIPARTARLDRREFHRRTASGALGTLVLRVEHSCFSAFSIVAVTPNVQHPR